MTTQLNRYQRQSSNEEQQLYDHFLSLVQVEGPEQLLQRFRVLFVEGVGYPDAQISVALDKLTAAKTADQNFGYILNRCCHILINRWQARLGPSSQKAIPALIALFKSKPSRPVTEYARARTVRRLRDLVQQFTESEQYLTLHRLAQVTGEADISPTDNGALGNYIRRYPYLYEHCLLGEGSSAENQQIVRQLQTQAQAKFEQDLSQFLTCQVRHTQIARLGSPATANRIIQPVPNPTLLSDRELGFALKHFVGKVDGANTCRDLAQRFQVHAHQGGSYRGFKDDLYQYITAGVDTTYGKRQFNQRLYSFLKDSNPQYDAHKLNEFLMVRTCTNLLNFLVVESPQNPHHFVFVDLISNIGATLTTGLLLRVVLLCRKVKPYLEKRFAILFGHYESYTKVGVQWLVKALENMNIALATNFGKADFSSIHQII
ncbi:hypothetical protein DO97_08560 [Neosynechococcus sphagnicola sy1]|uniref:Uncharacterized protein n=1 Tax=Neosynechococcus sphagnicola sy1 TaxID=1497020 RepID=A0A098TJN4_9CYAN|nr:hypothetical protein [Neosynechococcus sphagnicola]KGF72426.1 hypothetical protein DO97_08560 [Neosynechococcus sphagnicola sy1]